MSCTLATLAACFSLANAYVDTGLVVADNGVERYAIYTQDFRSEHNGIVETRHSESFGYSHAAQNPYGRITLGYAIDLSPRLSAALEVSHESSLATNADRGVNAIAFRLRWRPFARWN